MSDKLAFCISVRICNANLVVANWKSGIYSRVTKVVKLNVFLGPVLRLNRFIIKTFSLNGNNSEKRASL